MKVLISDDDATIRLLMRTLLQRKLGYEVVETTDGRKAWEVLDSGMAVDLCILDMWMPEMGGVDLVSKLRADPRFARQKVILCSSENSRGQILRAVSMGISGYLLKPFVAQHFVDQVQKVCQNVPAAAQHSPLEAQEAVLTRLDCEAGTYLELLGVFTKDVAALVADLRNPEAKLDKKELEIRLSGLRGSGRSLGAAAMVAALARLERIVPAGDMDLIRTCAPGLQNQNERIIAAMAPIASQVASSPDAPAEPEKSKPAAAKPKKKKAAE